MTSKVSTWVGCLALVLPACSNTPPPAAPETPSEQPAAVGVGERPATVQGEPEQPNPAASEASVDPGLETDFAKMEADAEREAARLTPELRESLAPLASVEYETVRAAYERLAASPHRTPGNAERDAQRHPVETLEFFGIKPSMTVLEYGPGAGWYTELLAPMLAAKGKLIVTSADPKGPRTERATLYGQRFARFLAKAPELYGKVDVVVVDGKQPELGLQEAADAALVIRGMHGWARNGSVQAWLSEIGTALKPGGVLGIVQHRAAPGADPVESAKLGYLPESWVIEQVEAAGFKLQEKSEINANPKDTRDHPEGVWALPPTLRLGDTDREKYLAIGESDRMTLRFVKAE